MLFCGTNALADGLIQCIGAGIDLVVDQLQGEFILLGQLLPELGAGVRVPLDVPQGVVVQQADVVAGALQLSGTLDPVVVAAL